ncbi:MAG: CHRD domain-containing protein [Planctomycetaceae bacterium]
MGTVHVQNSMITNNVASGDGGGIYNQSGEITLLAGSIVSNVSGSDTPGTGGGGIFNHGTMLLEGVTLSDNTAIVGLGNGGGILNAPGGVIQLTGGTVSNNSAARAGGGIENNNGTVILHQVALLSNTAGINGGGLHVSSTGTTGVAGSTIVGNTAQSEGGGLWNGTGLMTVIGNTLIDGNAAGGSGSDQGGGGVFNAGGTIEINGATIVNNVAAGGTVFSLDGGQEVPSVATSATGSAGFLFNPKNNTFSLQLRVTGVELTDSTALPELAGAHIHLAAAGTNGAVIVNLGTVDWVEVDGGIELSLLDIAFPAANVSDLLAGGTYINIHTSDNPNGELRGQIVFPATMGSGGGVLNDQGSVSIVNSTIFGNLAARAGGGIETNGGIVTVIDTTLDQNAAGIPGLATPGNGGGLHITGGGMVTITGGTVNGNTAANEGGGLWNHAASTLTVDGVTISGNMAPEGAGIFNSDAGASAVTVYESNLLELNNSGVTGTVVLTLDETDAQNPALTVTIQATGLEADVPHIQHIHGRFLENLVDPGMVNGSFFEGMGGIAVDSVAPVDPSFDSNNDGFLSLGEGLVGYGPVLLNLSSPQTAAPPSGEAPLANFNINDFPTAPGGVINFTETYTWDLTNADQARQFHNLEPLSFREIVLHGLTVGGAYDATAPIASTELTRKIGTVHVQNSMITNNVASGDGGGIYNQSGEITLLAGSIVSNVSGSDTPGTGGGGIFNHGTMLLEDVTLSDNTAIVGLGNGGGILNAPGGVIQLTGGTVSNNSAARAGGGIENNDGTVILHQVALLSNTAGINGGGLHVSSTGTTGVVDSTIVGNTAQSEGGGLWNGTGLMTVIGNTLIDGNAANGNASSEGGGGLFNDGGSLLLNGMGGQLVITGNSAAGTAGSGGGIFNNGGTLSVHAVTISGNTASRAGGGIEDNAGTVTIEQSTLSANSTGAAPGNGGALHMTGGGQVMVHNSTVSGNIASNEGGGLWNSNSGTMTLRNVTVTGNHAETNANGGGVFTVNGGTTIVQNTIVAGNTSGSGSTPDDAGGTFAAGSVNNLIGDAISAGGLVDGTAGNIVGVGGAGTIATASILSTVLADNGGPTLTHALVSGSPGIDTGTDLTAFFALDQTGSARIQGSASDIGAVEADPATTVGIVVSVANSAAVVEGDNAIFAVTLNQNPATVVTVTISTSSGSAISGSDFTATTQTLSFMPGGALSQNFVVPTINDAEIEVRESFFSTITGVTAAASVADLATGQIDSEDMIGTPILDAVSYYTTNLRPEFTWQAVDQAVRYEVWFSRLFPDGQRIFIGQSQIMTNSFTPPSDLGAGMYKYWVRAFDTNDNASPWSVPNSFEIKPTLIAPVTPTMSRRPTFEWEAIPNATSYQLYLRTFDGNVSILTINGTMYTPSVDLPRGTVAWWIRPSDAIANRGWSDTGVTDLRTTITAPLGTVSDTTPTFSWLDVQGAGRYILYVQSTTTNEVVIREDQLTSTSFTSSSPLSVGSYRVWVKAIDAQSNLFSSGWWSRPISFQVVDAATPEGSDALLTSLLIETDAGRTALGHLREESSGSESKAGTDLHNRQVASHAKPSNRDEAESGENMIQTGEDEALDQAADLDVLMSDAELISAMLFS